MSSMKDLLEKMDDKYPFAGEKATPPQKPGDQVRGTDKAPKVKRTVPYQKHPFQGKLVGGAAEESVEHIADQFRKELEEYGALGSGISSGSSMDRREVRQLRKDQKAQQQQADTQEDNIERQIKQLKDQMLAVKKAPTPVPNPNDMASVQQFAGMNRQKKAQITQLSQQIKQLRSQIAETKEAPAGTYFTKTGNLVRGKLTKDAKARGARQTDPKDNQRSKVPPVTQMTEAQFDEAAGEKDACYHKVKSRYKVWPSAYASGALVQCRKKGAKNWGNSKKK